MMRLLLRRLRRLSAASERSFSGLPAAQVRRTFLDFFRDQHQHLLVPSAPVRPRGDPSLLFVNAGMNQEEACRMAWSLLTEHYGIPADRLYVSYFGGDASSGLSADQETRDIWLHLGVPASRVLPFGLKDNFWEMGDTGPCGPCTEIHYDHVGGRNAAALVNAGGAEVVEIWNLVFIQYNREADHSLRLLPQFSVDTGMGLERLVGVLQGKRSNYDTDLFTPLLDAIHQRSRVGPYGGRMGAAPDAQVDRAYRVVADHIRTLAVCIADGVHPGMSGAELVLRRILRRAVRFCAEVLQAPPGSLASLVPTVAQTLGDTYPELFREADRIADIINENEGHFLSSLQRGSRLIQRTCLRTGSGPFPAAVAWSLYRDLGFPLDLVDLMLEERGIQVDRQELDRLVSHEQKMRAEQQADSRPRLLLDVLSLAALQRAGVPHTDDGPKYRYHLENGRYVFPACQATVLALYDGRSLVPEVGPGRRCGVILDRTCFYSEQGGQSHDRGYLMRDGLQEVLFSVEAVNRAGGYVVHQVTVPDHLRTGDQVELHLDQAHRLSCMVKHTATHILNFALRSVLGRSVQQRGSRISADRLRFDFSVKGPLSSVQLQQVDRCIRDVISANQDVHTLEVPLRLAGAIQGLRTVDEVYPDPVRVVSLGVPVSELLDGGTDRETSVELCCGTHLLQTGSIQDLVIVSEKQQVKGISRIVAVTGQDAVQARDMGRALTQEVDSLSARLSGSSPFSLGSALQFSKEAGALSDAVDNMPVPQWQRRELQVRLRATLRSISTAIRKLEARQAAERAALLLRRRGQTELLVDAVETDSPSVLMKTVNQLSAAAPLSHVMLLAHQRHSGKVFCACQVPKDSPALAASDWAVAVCRRLGGNAGGSALVAKGTGSSSDITEALRFAKDFALKKAGR
uniref:Alanine--tRNA ligase n=1 Tax=Poecilia latipinna TaxID=48699 RepID=A0A3B3V959_9TELE